MVLTKQRPPLNFIAKRKTILHWADNCMLTLSKNAILSIVIADNLEYSISCQWLRLFIHVNVIGHWFQFSSPSLIYFCHWCISHEISGTYEVDVRGKCYDSVNFKVLTKVLTVVLPKERLRKLPLLYMTHPQCQIVKNRILCLNDPFK